MELDGKLEKALQEKITIEQESSQIYFAMAQWLAFKGYFGAAKLYRSHAKEEMDHAKEVCDFLLDLGVHPMVSDIVKPETDFSSLLDVVEKSLEREKMLADGYSELTEMAMENKMVCQWALHMVKKQRWEIEEFLNWKDMLSFTPDYIVDKAMKKKA